MPIVTLVDSNQVPLTSPAGATDSGDPIKIGAVAQESVVTAVGNGQRVNLIANRLGALHVSAPIFGGSAGADARNALLGFAQRDQTLIAAEPVPTAVGSFILNGTTWDRLKKSNLTSRIPSSAATTNATVAKASIGEVHSITAMNTTASPKFLKLYNKATAPTVGTDTPVMTLALPVSNAPYVLPLPHGGHYFSLGISYALTGAAADADATALALGDVVGLNILYS